MNTIAQMVNSLLVTDLDSSISTSDVASLAGVERSVVSMWKKRKLNSEYPFPQSNLSANGAEYFDVAEVAQWFENTGLGNNPDAGKDAYLYTELSLLAGGRITSPMIEAVVFMRHELGVELTPDTEQLMSDADDIDPDDHYLYSEVEELSRLGQDAVVAGINLANKMCEHSYGAAHLLEVLSERTARRDREYRSNSMAFSLSTFCGELLGMIACAETRSEPLPRFVELSSENFSVTGNVLADEQWLAAAPDLFTDFPWFPTQEESGWRRQTLRRLSAHAVHPVHLDHADDFEPQDSAFFCFIPPILEHESALEILETKVLNMVEGSHDFSGVLVGPRELLMGSESDWERVRSELVRSGVLRVLCVLPEGLYPNHPREQLALWVLNKPSQRPTPEAHVYLADLQGIDFEANTRSIAADILSALNGSHARAFTYLGVQPVSKVAGARAIEFPQPIRASQIGDPSEDVVRVEEALLYLRDQGLTGDIAVNKVTAHGRHKPRLTVSEARQKHFVTIKSGHRVETELTTQGRSGESGIRIVDKEALIALASNPTWEPRQLATRIIPTFVIGQLEQIQLTKPGDVVFCQHGKTKAAWVDHIGNNVVHHPLKIMRARTAHINPVLAAKDINGHQAHPMAWRQWEIRIVPEAAAASSVPVFAELHTQRQVLVEKLNALAEFEDLLGDALSRGGVRVEAPK